MTGQAIPPTDPARSWATEHYGFDDEPSPAPVGPTSSGNPHVSRKSSSGLNLRSRTSRLVAAGLLGTFLAAGVGGAALAADAADGPGGGELFGTGFDGGNGGGNGGGGGGGGR